MSNEGTVEERVAEVAGRARVAATDLALATRAVKDAALLAMAEALVEQSETILAANADDVAAAEAAGTGEHLVDRLRLDHDRVEAMARGLREVAGLPDPVGEVLRGSTLANGLRAAPGARALRCGRHHLRGAAQRHRRRRRHLPEERQRRAAARVLERPSHERRGGGRPCAPPRSRPASRPTWSSWCPGRGTRRPRR